MSDRPPVKPGDWIKVAQQDCVVTQVSEDESSDGQCEVIFNPDEPRHSTATWNGEEWVSGEESVLPEFGEGGYAEKQPHLGMYVRRLKSGPGHPKSGPGH